jgi:Flp pilus assembly protein TadB
MGDQTMTGMTIILASLFSAGALYFVMMWFFSRRDLAARTEIERRKAAIDHANRERIDVRAKLHQFAAKQGWTGDLSVIAIALIFLYAVVVALLSLIKISGWLAPIIAIPASVLVVVWGASSTTHRRQTAFNRQLVQALDLLVAQLQSGVSAQLALERIVPNLPDPLRSEFDRALVRRRANLELSDAIAEVASRYPSRAMSMLVAALRIDEKRGAKMALALEQAAASVRRDFELRSEADAEIAQERMQFFGIVGIVGGIAVFLFARGSQQQHEALTSPTGIILVGGAAANFAFGIFRVMRMLRKAKGE